MVELIEQSKDQTGKIFYEPVILRVAAASQYNGSNTPDKHAWRFDGLENYWTCREMSLEEGQWYKIQLATKEHGGSQPYRDVMRVRLAETNEIPNVPPPTSNGARNGSQDEYRRSKEEMRWTEAYHMAARIAIALLQSENEDKEAFIIGWAGWFYNELANAGNGTVATELEESERVPAEDDGLPF
jgi:hypothetical protein